MTNSVASDALPISDKNGSESKQRKQVSTLVGSLILASFAAAAIATGWLAESSMIREAPAAAATDTTTSAKSDGLPPFNREAWEAGYYDHINSSVWRCTRVIDGRTIEVERGGETDRVRLLCIYTPELGESGHDAAIEELKKLVEGNGLTLLNDPSHKERDKEGNLLAYVIADINYGPTGLSRPLPKRAAQSEVMPEEIYPGRFVVNVAMVRLGHALYWTEYGESQVFQDEFRMAAGIADKSATGD